MDTTDSQTIETMFLEERRYVPPSEFAAQANAKPDIYDRDWEQFWDGSLRTPSGSWAGS
jgi:hypothetical protein